MQAPPRPHIGMQYIGMQSFAAPDPCGPHAGETAQHGISAVISCISSQGMDCIAAAFVAAPSDAVTGERINPAKASKTSMHPRTRHKPMQRS